MPKVLKLNRCEGEIVVTLDDTWLYGKRNHSGSISSNLFQGSCNEEDHEYNAAIDGLESLILACACEGINVTTEPFQRAVQTALDSIGNTIPVKKTSLM